MPPFISQEPSPYKYSSFNEITENQSDYNFYGIIYDASFQKYNEVKKALSHQRTISESICPRHHAFWEFIQYLLKIDPKERPSAKEALRHQFFEAHQCSQLQTRP